MRLPGYLTPNQFARRVGVHPNTAFAWAKRSANEEPSPLHGVVQTPSRRLFVPKTEVERLARERSRG